MLYQLSYYRIKWCKFNYSFLFIKIECRLLCKIEYLCKIMEIQYYIAIEGQSIGPMSLVDLLLHPGLRPNTLVWKTGMPDWKPAKEFPELESKFDDPTVPPEVKDFASNPQYKPGHSYQERKGGAYHRFESNHPTDFREPYHSQYNRPSIHTNWLPWAIVATIVGFFTSCIGAIFGIIGIVQANKANTFYAQGFDREGDAANSNAKIMTIIGLILAGIGIIVAGWFGYLFRSPGNISSFMWQ